MSPVDPPRFSAPTSDRISSLLQESTSAPQPAKVRTPVLETRQTTIAGWTVRTLSKGHGIINGRHVTINSGPIDKLGNAAMSDEDLKAELERLRNENAALKRERLPASA